MKSNIEAFHKALLKAENVFVITGAGISVASGIHAFRGTDPDAVWNRDVLEKGTYAYFEENTLDSWLWYLDRFSSLMGKQPNPGHDALFGLEKWCAQVNKKFTLVTQNIDGLHLDAGNKDTIEVHGTVRKVRCTNLRCMNAEPKGSIPFPTAQVQRLLQQKTHSELPTCPACGSVVRPHVLWFDEYYTAHEDYQFEHMQSLLYDADIHIFIGTSFSVGVTASVQNVAQMKRQEIWIIDPVQPDVEQEHRWLEGGAEILLPQLLERL